MIIDIENYKDILVGERGRISRTKKLLYTLPIDKWYKSIQEAVYCFENNIELEPRCTCGNSSGFISTHKGYRIYCSNKCKNNNTLNKYRGDIPDNLPELTIKDIDTLITESGRVKYSSKYLFKIPSKLYWCSSIIEAIYCLNNRIVKEPRCKCGVSVSFQGNKNNEGYSKFCGPICSNADENVKKNKVVSLMKRYGVENSSQITKGLTTSKIYSPEKYMMSSMLYIMRSDKNNMIKIGVSSNPRRRMSSFTLLYSDIEIIYSSAWINHVYMYEDFLHKKYGDYNMNLLEGDGRTEWFDESILEDVLDDMKSIEILF